MPKDKCQRLINESGPFQVTVATMEFIPWSKSHGLIVAQLTKKKYHQLVMDIAYRNNQPLGG